MAQGLSVQDVVNVSISLTANPAGYRNFGATLVLGSSTAIDITERKRQYANIEGVATDFGTTSAEYFFAQEFFQQSPQPNLLFVGRWAQNPTSAILHGASLVPLQRLLTNFTSITNGAFLVSVDGVPYALTGLSFASATNLNGVASTIQTALQNAGATGARVLWGANNNRFDIISGTTGATSTLSYASTPTAVGHFTFASQPANNSILTINGTTVTFVTASPTTGQVQIGASLSATLQSLLTYLNASSDTQLVKFRYSVTGSVLYLTSVATGTAGNAYTIVAGSSPASNATASGSTLTGGATNDISVTPLGLSITPTGAGLANADPPVPGVVAESLLSAVELFGDSFGDWYLLSVATATPPSDADHIAVAGYIQAAGQARTYWISSQNTEAYDDERTDDLGSILDSAGYDRTAIEFSSTNPYCVASVMALFATINYLGNNTTITGKFKLQPGVMPEFLTENQAAVLKSKNYNVYAQYQNGVAITQEAVMADGTFIDSRINADWLANYVQTNVFNLLRSYGKVPQTDEGSALIVANMAASLRQAVVNGYLAPGIWNAAGFGTLNLDPTINDFLPSGFYIYAPPVASQTETTRAQRKSVLFQIAAKEAGAIHSANIAINVNP